jgi:DNA-binding MarR family transcriptional regulator
MLRVLNVVAFPPRLVRRFWELEDEMMLDLIDKPLYRSAMNHVDRSVSSAAAPPLAPQEASLFTFLDVADRLYERVAEALGRIGLSYAKYEVLKHLRDAEGPVSLSALAEGQHCARSNITQLIDRLETEGLVRRVDDPGDRRAVRADLTEAGAAQVEDGATQIDLVRAQFAAAFTAAERLELGRLLARVP